MLVIVLFMALLTFFGSSAWTGTRDWLSGVLPESAANWLPAAGPKSLAFPVEIPAGSTVEQPDDRTLIVTPPVVPDSGVGSGAGNARGNSGRPVRHVSESKWRIRVQDDGSTRAFGSRVSNRFLERENLLNLANKASYFAVIAVGMTAVIILAGIDLSVGSIYALAAMVGAMAVSGLDAQASTLATVSLALLVCCGVGGLAGFANGAMTVGLRVHPFIITLGTMAVYRGVVFVLSKGQTVAGLPDSLQKGFFKADPGGFGIYPIPTLIMVGVALAGMFVLSQTVFGRRVYAVGGNETAARYAGIPVGRIKIMVYTITGVLSGLSACMYIGYFGAAESAAGSAYELQVIAAAVIGGASLSGGRGSAIGAMLGAIVVQLIDNAIIILDISQNYNQIIMGGAIIAAVVIDQTKVRMGAKR